MANEKYTSHLSNKNVQAFLKMIQWSEGANYNTLVHKGTNNTFIKDLSRHPNIKVPGNPASTAAGAYQFLYTTWVEVANRIGATSFQPNEQDAGAVYLIDKRGALQFIKEGKVYSAINACVFEWASFPSLENTSKNGYNLVIGKSAYGQGSRNINDLISVYKNNGGTVTDSESELAKNASSIVGGGDVGVNSEQAMKERIEALKKKVDLDALLLNLGNLEEHQVDKTWGSRLNANEHSDWIGFKQFILYLCKTYMPQAMIPLSELIPIFTMENTISNAHIIGDSFEKKKENHDKLLERYEKTSNLYEEMRNTGGIDLLSLDPFGEMERFKQTRNLSYKTIGNLTLDAGTDGSTLSKAGAVGVRSIKITQGDSATYNKAFVEIEMVDVAGNKFLDIASPWSFLINYATFGGDFLFRYGWQVRLPKLDKECDENSMAYKFWNHEGWKLFGVNMKSEFFGKLRGQDYTINLTQSNDPDALWYKGFITTKVEGTETFVRDLRTDVAVRSKFYMTLGSTNKDLKVDSKTSVSTLILSFMTTDALANFMCPITKNENTKKLLGEIEDSKTNLFEFLSAFFKDNQEYIKTTTQETQDKFNSYYKDFTALTSKEDICRLIQVRPIEDDGLGFTGTFATKDPREIPVIITDELGKTLKNVSAGDTRVLWSWFSDVLQANNIKDVSTATNQTALFTFTYDDRKTIKNSEGEILIQNDAQFADATGFLTEQSYKRIFEFDDVFSFRFQGSLVKDLSVVKADQETAQTIQASDNRAEEVLGSESDLPSGSSKATTQNSTGVLQQGGSLLGTVGNKPESNTKEGYGVLKSDPNETLLNKNMYKNTASDKLKNASEIGKDMQASQEALKYGKVVWQDASKKGYVNAKLIEDIHKVAHATGIEITIGSSYRGSRKKGDASRHMRGMAVDLPALNGFSYGYKREEFTSLGNRVAASLASMGYQVITKQAESADVGLKESKHVRAILWQTMTGANHYNHLHVSNTDVTGNSPNPSGSYVANLDNPNAISTNGQESYNVYKTQIDKVNYANKEDLLRFWLSTMRNVTISAVGHPWLQLSKSFFIKGKSYFDGKYIVTKIEHTIANNDMTTVISGVSVIFGDNNYAETQANLEGSSLKGLEETTKTANKTTPVIATQ